VVVFVMDGGGELACMSRRQGEREKKNGQQVKIRGDHPP